RQGRTRAMAAAAMERADPSLRNLVITAEELTREKGGTPPYMRTRVISDASRRLAAADLSSVARLSPDAAALLVSIVVLLLAANVRVRGAQRAPPVAGMRRSSNVAASDVVLIEIVPPSYTGRPAVRLKNPAALEALAGSQATIHVPDVGGAEIRL